MRTRPGVEGIVCALPLELGAWRERVRSGTRHLGLEVLELDAPVPARAVVCGVGKVAAARAVAALCLAGDLRRLWIVGTCGSLRVDHAVGARVHCTRAVQADLGVREGRVTESDPAMRALWRSVAEGAEDEYLTADRAVLSPWRRWWTKRRHPGGGVCDMETAAAAATAQAAGIPFAALRVVTDLAGWGGAASFRRQYETLGPRAADTLQPLFARLRDEGSLP